MSYYNHSNDPTTAIAMKDEISRQGGIPLVYPLELADMGETKAVSFYVIKYDKAKAGRQEQLATQLSKIYLPVPPELSTGDALDYEEFSAPLVQNAVEALQSGISGRLKDTVNNGLSAVAVVADKLFAQDAKYAQSLAGMVVNPRNTNLFKSPKAREYQFTYKLIATSFEESKSINEIVKRFRYHAYPEVNSGEGVFYVPDIFLIAIKQYKNNQWIENDYMFKPLPCALIGMNVQYNGDSPVTFFKESGAPVEVTLTLNFVEMELDNKQQLASRYYKEYGADIMQTFTPQQPEELSYSNSGITGTQTLNRPKQSTTAGRYDTTNNFPSINSRSKLPY